MALFRAPARQSIVLPAPVRELAYITGGPSDTSGSTDTSGAAGGALITTAGSSPTAGSKATTGLPEGKVGVAAVLIFVAALAVAVLAFPVASAPSFTPAEGIGLFALFYIVAQAAERVVELLMPLIARIKPLDKPKAAHVRDLAFESGSAVEAPPHIKRAAADAQAALDQVTTNRRAVSFALTAAVGLLLCGSLSADFLTTVGVTFPAGDNGPSAFAELIGLTVTGLVVGGGSDGLHGLITNLQKSSAKKDDPRETGGQA